MYLSAPKLHKVLTVNGPNADGLPVSTKQFEKKIDWERQRLIDAYTSPSGEEHLRQLLPQISDDTVKRVIQKGDYLTRSLYWGIGGGVAGALLGLIPSFIIGSKEYFAARATTYSATGLGIGALAGALWGAYTSDDGLVLMLNKINRERMLRLKD